MVTPAWGASTSIWTNWYWSVPGIWMKIWGRGACWECAGAVTVNCGGGAWRGAVNTGVDIGWGVCCWAAGDWAGSMKMSSWTTIPEESTNVDWMSGKRKSSLSLCCELDTVFELSGMSLGNEDQSSLRSTVGPSSPENVKSVLSIKSKRCPSRGCSVFSMLSMLRLSWILISLDLVFKTKIFTELSTSILCITLWELCFIRFLKPSRRIGKDFDRCFVNRFGKCFEKHKKVENSFGTPRGSPKGVAFRDVVRPRGRFFIFKSL